MQINKFKAECFVKRLDHFLKEKLVSESRSKIEKYISDGFVKIDNKICLKKSTEVKKGSIIEIAIREPSNHLLPNSYGFNKLFEDDHILIIDKPEGISVHKGSGTKEPTIADYFLINYPELKNIGNPDRPGIIHRLDKGTSGVLVLAKSDKVLKIMQKKFKRREITKTYHALVAGRLRFKNGSVNIPIIRNPKDRRKFTVDQYGRSECAKDALTYYSLRYQFENFAYVSIKPHTGRTHQIRVHMSHIGNPVLGDEFYGKKSTFKRLALHSYSISFVHPIDKSITIFAYTPDPFLFCDFF